MAIIPWYQINPSISPKFTLFIGPTGSLNKEGKKSPKIGGAHFLDPNSARYSALEAVLFTNKVQGVVDRGLWFCLTATYAEPYEMLRELLKYRMHGCVFIEQIIHRGGGHA